MNTKWIAVVVGLCIGTVVAVAQNQEAQPPAPAAEPRVEEVPVETPLAIPEEDSRKKNPLEPTPESVANGVTLYASQCSMCHGRWGGGDGQLAKDLYLEMPDFRDPQKQASRTDGELYYILTRGHGEMPGEGDRLPQNWKWELVLAIRSFERAAAN